MDDQERADLLKKIDLKALKGEVKARGIACGRCPTKASLAQLLPDEALLALAKPPG